VEDIVFKFFDLGICYVIIQNKNSGKFLAVAFSSKDAAANVIQFDDNSQEDILWKLLPLY
jgi:hypothetical protein